MNEEFPELLEAVPDISVAQFDNPGRSALSSGKLLEILIKLLYLRQSLFYGRPYRRRLAP